MPTRDVEAPIWRVDLPVPEARTQLRAALGAWIRSELLTALASSRRSEIKGEMRDEIARDVTLVRPRTSWPARLWHGVAHSFAVSTINVRVKLRQRRRAVELARSLRALGVDLPDPKAVRGASARSPQQCAGG